MRLNKIQPRNSSVDGGSVALIFYVFPENFDGGSANRAKKESAGPECALVTTMEHTAELIQECGSRFAFERSNHIAQTNSGRIPKQKMHVIALSPEFHDFALAGFRDLPYTTIDKVLPFCGEYMFPEFNTKDDVHRQIVNTVTCTVKLKVPDALTPRLDDLNVRCEAAVHRMLDDRTKSSSKYYSDLVPCVISKSLIAKYQRNKKLRAVSNLVIPICGDKGRQVKLEGCNIRIPALFGKSTIPVFFYHPPVRDEQGRVNLSAEFFHRAGQWYVSLTYKTIAQVSFRPTGMIGVDQNSVGAIATMADPATGKVFHLGFNPARTKSVWRGRKRNLQKARKNRLLAKLRRNQSRRTKHENHKVSKYIVDYARAHRRAIVLEDLSSVRSKGSKIRSYAERNQWSFYQLLQFIRYKAALSGVMVFEVNPAYSSQECSRCHERSKPNGKRFLCGYCGHNDHRDANAAFTLAQRVMPTGGIAQESECLRWGLLVVPSPGTGVESLGTLSLTTPRQANGITEFTL